MWKRGDKENKLDQEHHWAMGKVLSINNMTNKDQDLDPCHDDELVLPTSLVNERLKTWGRRSGKR